MAHLPAGNSLGGGSVLSNFSIGSCMLMRESGMQFLSIGRCLGWIVMVGTAVVRGLYAKGGRFD
jgi:hypothetical protein